LFKEVEFDVFHENVLRGFNYHEYDFDVNLKASPFKELAELVQVLMIVPDELYYSKIDQVIQLLEKKLGKPEFPIQQKMLIIEKKIN